MPNVAVDVRDIVGRIRERLGRRDSEDARGVSILTDRQLPVDLSQLYATRDPAQAPLASHRKLLGQLVTAVKRVLSKLLTPFFNRQTAYNTINARIVSRLHEHLAALAEQQARLRTELVAALRDDLLAAQQADARALREDLAAAQHAAAAEARALRADFEDLSKAVTALREEFAGAVRAARESALARAQFETEPPVLRRDFEALRAKLDELADAAQAVHRRHEANLLPLRERMASTEARLRRLLAGPTESPGGRHPDAPAVATAALPTPPAWDSMRFAERFWGSEAEVAERRRGYVALFRGHDDVLDLGCGRGEFLALLAEAGITARGVDTDLDMVLLCRDKGLDVTQDEACTQLAALPEGSLGGIFAAQIVEHLDAERVSQLLGLCHRTLRPGGVLVIETPNPTCLMIFAQCFYMDFTHTRPIHAEALKFLAECVGFSRVTVQFTSPVGSALHIPLLSDPRLYGPQGEQFNRAIAYVNELLFGYQDYAIVAHK